MKKTISILLSLTLLFSLAIPALALPRSAGAAILRTQFDRAEGPYDEAQALNVDYSFFSPVKGKSDRTLYPLVVITPGALEGQNEGEELKENNFAMWACDEFQARFAESGGAFIMIARAQEDVSLLLNWSSAQLITPLYLAIEDFCASNPNVDTDRIYGIGWCQGAKAMINLNVYYPGLIDSYVLMGQNFLMTDKEAQAMAASDVWLLGSVNDSLGLYNEYIKPTWEKLCAFASRGSKRTFTTYTKAQDTGLAIQHGMWDDACYDWDYSPKTTYAKSTIDNKGNSVSIKSFIGFISGDGSETYSEAKPTPAQSGGIKLLCTCGCKNYSGLQLIVVRIYNRILTLVARLLGTTAVVSCDCENCTASQ